MRCRTASPFDSTLPPEEVQHVVLLSLTTRGFPAAVAAWGWVHEVPGQD